MISTETSISDTIQASTQIIRTTDQIDTINRSCSLNIESDGSLTLSTQHPDANGTSMAIYNGLVLSFSLPMGVVPSALADWIEERLDDVRTLVDGMDRRWDGSNMRGTLSDEAQAISDDWSGEYSGESALTYLDSVQEWEASDWLSGVRQEIESQPSREAAVACALESVPTDGLWTDDGVTSYIDRDDVAGTAAQWWEDAQPDIDE